MRGTILGVIAAFLLGAALAVALRSQPLLREIVAFLTGDNAFDRCIKAGACNAVRGGPPNAPPRLPPVRPQEAPADMDRA